MVASLGGSLRLASSHAGDQLLGCSHHRVLLPAGCLPPPRRRRCLTYASSSSSSSGSVGDLADAKQLTILHFNDVYNIEQRAVEPVGGAARFASALRRFRHEQPLVLFSGDCLNPSLMSAFTRGEQMVPILNSMGVHAAAVGNHDFDFGIPMLQKHMRSFRFPWLLSNVLDARTGQPLGGAYRSRIIDWQGVRVGLVGLVEREWLLTIPSVEESDIRFLDFCDEGQKLAGELSAQGADLIVALTHMRTPNDLVLAAEVPEIQLVLGGHDHHWEATETRPHGTLVFKSGTDFREFSVLRVGVPPNLKERPAVRWERVEITSAVPEDPEVAAIVRKYQDLIGTKMDEPMGWSHTDLDARFDSVRAGESNLGSLFADVMRISLGADAAFFNGGTIRSDQLHAAGQLLMRDFVSMLPFTDDLVLLELNGKDLLAVLETGVGGLPALEGRFLQVSGIRFAFDPSQPPGSRVEPGSVEVAGQQLELQRTYKVATKAYLRGGKDGFDSLKASTVLVDGETNPRLATLVQYLWMRVEQLNETMAEEWQRMVQSEQQRLAAETHADSTTATTKAAGLEEGQLCSNGREYWEQGALVSAAVASSNGSGRAGNGSSSGDAYSAASRSAGLAAAGGRAAAGQAVYSPGAPICGTATGGPGSIPYAAEQHVHEVSSTGAAISLALLLQHRSELQERQEQEDFGSGGSSSRDEGSSISGGSLPNRGHPSSGSSAPTPNPAQEGWLPAFGDDWQAQAKAQAHSTAALSALAYLEPCAHGLDELILFDPMKRRFGINPRVEGRIRRVQHQEQQQSQA